MNHSRLSPWLKRHWFVLLGFSISALCVKFQFIVLSWWWQRMRRLGLSIRFGRIHKRRRKNSRKKNGHRQRHSKIQITKILAKGGKVISEAKKSEKKKTNKANFCNCLKKYIVGIIFSWKRSKIEEFIVVLTDKSFHLKSSVAK